MTKANLAPQSPRSSSSIDPDSTAQAEHSPFQSLSEDDSENSAAPEGDNGGGSSTNHGGTGTAG